METKKVSVDTTNCISCSICIQSCPVSALSLSLKGKSGKYDNFFPEPDYEKCIGCGLCVKACPMECIALISQEKIK